MSSMYSLTSCRTGHFKFSHVDYAPFLVGTISLLVVVTSVLTVVAKRMKRS